MYSSKIQAVLERAGLKAGDRVVVRKGGRRVEGLLMPRIGAGDPDCVIIKLDSGYNIGVEFSGTSITKAGHREPKAIREEKNFELGRINRNLVKVLFDSSKPHVSLISTGGTITSRVDYRTGGVTAMMEPKEMLHNVPELAGFCFFRLNNPFTIMSESMGPEHWQEIAETVAKELKTSEGVIVTQGTDTLHFTAAALSFMLRDLGKPVVLTAAQKSTDRGSSDAALNLICSARAALSDMAAVGICMHGTPNDDYCIFSRGTKVRKMHTSRRDAFRSINEPPLARVWPDGKIEKLQPVPARGKTTAKADTLFEKKVALVKSYAGARPDIIDFYVKEGCRGLVLEAMGLGQFPTAGKNSWLGALKSAADRGVILCAAPTTIYGRLNPNVYSEGRQCRDAGIIYLEDMLPETAYVKLGWVLGHTKSVNKAKEMMLTNCAGEISERGGPEGFLC
jgi:glutamyl-tRNA(Gln) amidotransferase subunit D